MDKDIVIIKIKDVLNKTFSIPQKCSVKDNFNTLRFSCPLCHDSLKDIWKKRGNFYLDSGNYHCFNCGIHMNAIKFFKFFNVELNIEESNHFYKLLAQNANNILKTNLELGEILKYSINFKKFIKKFGITICNDKHPFIIERCLKHKTSVIGFKGNNIYIFNLIGDRLLGFQIKENYGTKYERYNKVPLSEIYKTYIKTDKVNYEELQKFDKISLLYGLFLLNFNEPVTIFEGAINSFFMKNSMATSTANLKLDLLGNIPKKRFMFDNDSTGIKKMLELLKNNNCIFLWNKFLLLEKIVETKEWKEYRKNEKKSTDINDMNDIILYCKINKRASALKNLDNYFSNNQMDSVFL